MRNMRFFKEFSLNLVPTFETVLLEFVEEPGFLGQFISKVSDHMRCPLH